jgi:hypothetical protein
MLEPQRSLLPLILVAASCAVYDANLVSRGGGQGGAGAEAGSAGAASSAGKGATQAGAAGQVSGGGGGAAGSPAGGTSAGTQAGAAGNASAGAPESDAGAGGEAEAPGYYGSDTLLAYYRFDSDAGLQAIDSSGHGHHGTLAANAVSAPPTWTTGRLDGALAFAGNDFVLVPYTAIWNNINTASAYTIAAWTYRQANKTSWAMIVSRQYNATTAEHFALSWRDGRAAALAITHIGQAATTGALNTWVHIAATYDGATLKIYEDGVEVSSSSAPGPMFQDDMTTGLVIGGNINAADPVGETFVGSMDELVIYSRVLTLAELANLAAAQAPPIE